MCKAKRAVILLLSAMLVLGGCASGTAEMRQISMKITRSLTMQVSEKDAMVREEAERFAARVSELSGGMLEIEVQSGFPDHETVASGEADFAFLSNIQMAQANSLFGMLSLPFTYDDYNHMSIALNSEEMLTLLTDRLAGTNLLPMMAHYNGTSCLVTNRGELRVPSDFRDLAIAMRTDNAEKIRMFEVLGARVLPYSHTSLVPMLGQEVEILPDDLTKPGDLVTIDTIEVDLEQALQLLSDPDSLYLIRTFHNLSPLWLVANQEAFASLSAWEQAVVREGLAGLLAQMELRREGRDRELLAQMVNMGIEIVDIERPEIGVAIYGSSGTGTDKYTPPAAFDRRVYQMIQNCS